MNNGSQKAKDKYLKEKVDTFVLRVPKGKKDEIMEYAKSKGMSLNGYITELIFADMGITEAGEKKSMPAPKTEKTKKAPKTANPKAATAKTEPAIIKEEKAPIEEPQVQEEEVKKKKRPSFLL